jgi:hypothetical protein
MARVTAVSCSSISATASQLHHDLLNSNLVHPITAVKIARSRWQHAGDWGNAWGGMKCCSQAAQ